MVTDHSLLGERRDELHAVGPRPERDGAEGVAALLVDALLDDLLLEGGEVGGDIPGAGQRVVHRVQRAVVRVVRARGADQVEARPDGVHAAREARVVRVHDGEAAVLDPDVDVAHGAVGVILEAGELPGGARGLWRHGVVEERDVLVAAVLLQDPLLAGVRHVAHRGQQPHQLGTEQGTEHRLHRGRGRVPGASLPGARTTQH